VFRLAGTLKAKPTSDPNTTFGAGPLSEEFERCQRLIRYDSALLADIAAGRTAYRFRPEKIAVIQARQEHTRLRIAAIAAGLGRADESAVR
jgi:hypothetical protein